MPYERIFLTDRVSKVTFRGNVSRIDGEMFIETAVSEIILPESVSYINAQSVAVRADVSLIIRHKGDESSCQIDESEMPLPENVALVWNYEEPVEPPCQMEEE